MPFLYEARARHNVSMRQVTALAGAGRRGSGSVGGRERQVHSYYPRARWGDRPAYLPVDLRRHPAWDE